MDLKENIVMLLAKTNMSSIQIARTLGCTPAYITQVQESEEVQNQITDLKADQAVSTLLRQEKLEKISERAMNALDSALQSDLNMRPYEAAKVLQIIENLPGRMLPMEKPGGKADGVQTVVINLPAGYQNQHIAIELNTNNEIVEINGREMRSMDSRTLLQNLEIHKQNKGALPAFAMQLENS